MMPKSWLLLSLLLAGPAWSNAAEAGGAVINLHPRDPSLRHEVSRAIEKGQAWIASHQGSNGEWSSPDYPAVTALALSALRAAPGGTEAPPTVTRAGYDFLLSCVQADGGIYRKDLSGYNTSISLTALVLANRREWRPVILRARNFVAGLQTPSGGIGYGKTEKEPDLSNTSWAVEALALSKAWLAGELPPEAKELDWQAAVAFIQSCQNLPGTNQAAWAAGDAANQGGFIYAPGASKAGETNLAGGKVALRSYGSMSYAGLMSYLYADLKPDDGRVRAVVDWLGGNFSLEENPGMGAQGLYYYYHTMAKALTVYGSDTLPAAGGRAIAWRSPLALKLINLQHPDGSWSNDNGRWFEKDPVLVTAYSVLALKFIVTRL